MPDYDVLTVEELCAEAQARGLSPGGLRKAELVELLAESDAEAQEAELAAEAAGDAAPDGEAPTQPARVDAQGRWWCPVCDYSHPADHTRCANCGWERPK